MNAPSERTIRRAMNRMERAITDGTADNKDNAFGAVQALSWVLSQDEWMNPAQAFVRVEHDGGGDTVNAITDAMTTYKRADGELIGEYGWVTDEDYIEDEWEPVELVREVWHRVTVERYWRFPEHLYDCALDHCDEDAVAWVCFGDRWEQRCEAHREPVGDGS